MCKACGAAADGDGVGDGVVGGESGFEGDEFGAEAEVGSAQDGSDGVDFCFGDVWSGERDHGIEAGFVLVSGVRTLVSDASHCSRS